MSNEEQNVEPPLTRRERLRRAVILSAPILPAISLTTGPASGTRKFGNSEVKMSRFG